ncbi:phospholipase [Sparganum proliferum]
MLPSIKTKVKELGIFLFNCPELVSDLEKVLLAFCAASGPNVTLPLTWPEATLTKYNRTSPMPVMLNGIPTKIYITMSPPPLTPPSRNDDLDAILHIIQEAESYIYVSVMAYAPAIVSYSLSTNNEFWPVIDDALRSASLNRKVEVRLLISHWRHTPASLGGYLGSLRAIHGINGARLRVRYFVVPAFSEEQRQVPFGRVNHNKYMVTDKVLYIGTSNWSGDYFYRTGGAAFVAEEEKNQSSTSPPLREQLTDIFYRDWNSEYTQEL